MNHKLRDDDFVQVHIWDKDLFCGERKKMRLKVARRYAAEDRSWSRYEHRIITVPAYTNESQVREDGI